MISALKQTVIEAAPNRPPGYLEYIQINSEDDGVNFLIPDDVFENALIGHFPKPKGLGDLVESAAKPIAKALGLKCIDGKGNLKPESKCAKRRDWLNRVTRRRR